MHWPNRTEYMQAVRDYRHIAFQDPKLKGGNPKLLKDGSVSSHAGGFSIVFPIDMGSNTFALRCWTQEVSNAEMRYEKISAYLKQACLPYFVDFEYVSEGIMVNGDKYSITRMEWANGKLLRDFIDRNLQDFTIFKTVADEFQKMVADLHTHQISHGDLQDGNILLKRNGANVEIKLIDYDSLFVPDLRGQLSLTEGLPGYQHPGRGGLFNKKVDYFSELVIYLSFLSLSEQPNLWARFGDKNRVDQGLLFSKEDFENPDQSDIFQELEKLSPDVQQLATTLKDFCAKTSIDQLEPLEEILPKPDANTYNNRGEVLLNDGRYNEALAEFRKAIAFDPNYEKARYGIGLVYLHTKRYIDAINAFEQLITGNPNYKEAHHGLSLAYFKSGGNNKATAAANAALRIDPYYQPAHQLLDAIRSAMLPPVPPKPPGPVPPPPDPIPKTGTNPWRYVINGLKSNWHSVTAVTFGLALVICFIAFLTQMDAKDTVFSQNTELTKQLTQKESKILQKDLEIQGLTSSVQTLKSANQKLSHNNGELQKKLDNRTSTTNSTFGHVMSLRRQLNNQIDENQELQAQLIKKDTEIQQLQNDKTAALNENQGLKKQLVRSDQGTANQTATIRQLHKERTEHLARNRRLQEQLVEKTSEAKNLNEQVQQLQNEKIETQRHNQKLQSENTYFIRQNRNLRDENASLQAQPNKPNRRDANQIVGPEPPKKIHDYRNVITRAGVYNNHGILSLEKNEYNKAIAHFRAAIKVDSKFEVAHYNLGCTFLEMKDYPKAISAFSDAVGVNHKFKEAYYNLGLAHLGKGTYSAAKSSAELALRIDKNYQQAHNLLRAIENYQQ